MPESHFDKLVGDLHFELGRRFPEAVRNVSSEGGHQADHNI